MYNPLADIDMLIIGLEMYMSMLNSRVDKRETAHWLGVMFSHSCQEFDPCLLPYVYGRPLKCVRVHYCISIRLYQASSHLLAGKRRRSEFPCWDCSYWRVKAIFLHKPEPNLRFNFETQPSFDQV